MTETKHTPIVDRSIHGSGRQKIYRFPNNLGASAVKHQHSYGYSKGLWELAVIKFHSADDLDWSIAYDTPVTDDVIGWLAEQEIETLLNQIADLTA
jgi:hypothetical protein